MKDNLQNRDNRKYSAKGKGRNGKSFRKENDKKGGSPDRFASYDEIRSNPIRWWNRADVIYQDATRVPFNKIVGFSYPYSGLNTYYGSDSNFHTTMLHTNNPNIMVFDYTPGVGKCGTYTDPVNRAFQSMWSAMYSKTSGTLDLPVYSLAMITLTEQSLVQNVALVKRALETSHLYSAENMIYPRTLLAAQGFIPDSVIGRQDEIRMEINDIIDNINSLRIPASIQIFERQYALSHNIWADQDSIWAQLYLFRPSCYYELSDLGSYDASSEEFDGKLITFARKMPYLDGVMDIMDLIDIIQHQLAVIRNSRDFALVSGALKRAFEDSAFLRLDKVLPDQKQIPIYDETMSYQIHNMTINGYPVFEEIDQPNLGGQITVCANCHISGDPITGLIKYNPYVSIGTATGCGDEGSKVLLNTFNNSVDADWIMESTRFINLTNYEFSIGSDEPQDAVPFILLGTEFVNGGHIWITNEGDTDVYDFSGYLNVSSVDDLKVICAFSKFHKAPRLMVSNDATDTIPQDFVGDLNFWTTVDYTALLGLNKAALLSIFAVTAEESVKDIRK